MKYYSIKHIRTKHARFCLWETSAVSLSPFVYCFQDTEELFDWVTIQKYFDLHCIIVGKTRTCDNGEQQTKSQRNNKQRNMFL